MRFGNRVCGSHSESLGRTDNLYEPQFFVFFSYKGIKENFRLLNELNTQYAVSF